jgi:hypothetical protein
VVRARGFQTEVFQERPFLNNLPSSSKCGNELPTRPPTGLDNRRANTRYVHLTRLKLLNSKNFFKGGLSVVDGQLFTILVLSLHNVQNQMYCYIWLRLATCFGRYPAIIRPTRNSFTKVHSTSFFNNKQCLSKKIIPNYANIKVPVMSPAAHKTRKKIQTTRIKDET